MIARRALLAAAIGGAGLIARPGAARGRTPDLYDDVVTYDAFGTHRTGSTGDARTSDWIARRLASLGYAVDRQPFPCTLSEPTDCHVSVGAAKVPAFPIWPPVWAPAGGLVGPLSAVGGGGAIAVVRLPYATNGSLLAPGYREPLLAAVGSGAAGVIGITEGPTGDVIALNALPARFKAGVPTVLVGARAGAVLTRAATRGGAATLVSIGTTTAATAANILARRGGTGRALVISTPISGWFTCAGERGAGIAILLRLARDLPQLTRRPLVFLCTSGHEFEGDGSAHALASGLPASADVECWFHIGANVAGAQVAIGARGAVTNRGLPVTDRGTRASAALVARAELAFRGIPGFANVQAITPENAVGDIVTYLRAGYAAAGIVGSHPLHHTELDRPSNATTPALLAQTYDGCRRLLQTI